MSHHHPPQHARPGYTIVHYADRYRTPPFRKWSAAVEVRTSLIKKMAWVRLMNAHPVNHGSHFRKKGASKGETNRSS